MTADDRLRQRLARLGESDGAVGRDETLGFEAADHLTDGGATDLQAFGDPCLDDGHVVFVELEDALAILLEGRMVLSGRGHAHRLRSPGAFDGRPVACHPHVERAIPLGSQGSSGHHARRCGSCARPGAACPSTGPLRGEGSILDAIKQPDLAAELTLQPVRRYGVDAAVLYSDIVVPGARRRVRYRRCARAPARCASSRLRTAADLDRLRPFEPEADTPYVLQTVKILAAELADDVPLLGVRRRAVHRRQLPDRGPAQPHATSTPSG